MFSDVTVFYTKSNHTCYGQGTNPMKIPPSLVGRWKPQGMFFVTRITRRSTGARSVHPLVNILPDQPANGGG